jgi:hypothetical protein
MQQLLFVCFLLLTASLLRAGDLPKLNLEVGKKYTIETIYHEDTSKVNPRREYDKKIFEFTPTAFDKNKGIYDVKLVITYFMHVVQLIQKSGMWMETAVYETGFTSNFSRPVVFMNKHQVPVTFKLSTEGEITAFDFSAYYNYKTLGDLAPMLGEGDQKEMEVEIRGMFFFADEIRVPWYGPFKLRSNYTIFKENENSLEVKVDAIDKTGSIEQFKRTVLIDKTTGLILEDQLSYNWILKSNKSIIRYQKWIPVFSGEFEADQKMSEWEYIKTTISNPNTTIRVTVQDSTEYPQFIYLSYFDQVTYSFQTYRLEKGRNGSFCFQTHLDQPAEVYLHNNPELHTNLKAELCSLRPGDNLQIEIRKPSEPDRLIFKGIGAEENLLKQAIRKLSTSPGKFQIFFSNASIPINQDSAYHILNQYKLLINPELYLEMGNTLLYEKFWSKQTSLSDSISNLKIPVCNTLAAKNYYYINFLNQYISSFAQKIRLSSSNYKPSVERYEGDYSIAQALFPEPILTQYLASTVEAALWYGKWENARLLYERHMLTYPESPRTLKTKQIYHEMVRFAPGSIFPIEQLVDIYGKVFNFRKEKNKLVLITVNQILTATNLIKETELWRQTKRDYVSLRDNITRVRLVFGSRDQLPELKAALGLNSDERIIFINFENAVWGNMPYSPLLVKKRCVLGRDGLILYDRDVDSPLLQNAIEELQTPHLLKGASNFVLKIIALSLLGIIILAGFAFMVYRQVSRRQLKRAELSRRMRELELTVIRTQMNPHFMYNCLNSIQNLVQKNQNEEAHLYLSKFASLVRQVLNNSKKEEIPLIKELDSVKEYIGLEQLRFDFEYKLEVSEGVDVNAIFVPPMLLQPFVENAILHGLLLKKSDRLLVIRILKEHAKITLVVEDNGVGREAAGKSDQTGNGQGILLCRNRLSLLSEKTGIHYDLTIDDLTDENLQPTGTRVSIGFVEED